MNKNGQQHYKLLGASGSVKPLYTGKHLSTIECLDWLCDLPPDRILVGFSFGYDASQILRDIPPDRLDWLFDERQEGEGKAPYLHFGNFDIWYLPRNFLRVRRTIREERTIDGRVFTVQRPVPDSTRTIYETFGFFQKSFLAALQDFEVGRKHWVQIERNKAARSDFMRITKEIREYNRLECELLAELMETFRDVCHAADLRPKSWNGAGKLSAFLHAEHGTITAKELESLVPAPVRQMAADAYYGGRFEVPFIGELEGIHEADIGSAYPAAMPRLPCLLHGTWEAFTGNPPSGLHVAYVAFSHPVSAPLCGLPVRQKDGRLFWPREGQGIYWSPEIKSARRLGAKVRYTMGWHYRCNCECRVFDWVAPLFRKRRALGKDHRGYPIKLGLNSLYGKLAQRIGTPRWGNFVWAGLITALTRAKLNHAIAQAPFDIVMIATDAIFSKKALKLRYGSGLGEWEAKQHKRLFICQPGVYFGASRPKTRGVPVSILREHVGRFERDWRTWCLSPELQAKGPPIVKVPVPLFVGLRLAHARGKAARERGETVPDGAVACRWMDGRKHPPGHPCHVLPREFSFDWSRKRASEPHWEGRFCVRTMPAAGAPDLVSVPHSENKAWSLLNTDRMEFDDQQDHIDLSPIV